MRPTHPTKPVLAAAAGAALVLAACTNDPEASFEDPTPESPTPSTQETEEASTDRATAEDEESSAESTDEPELEPVTLTERIAYSGGSVELEVEIGPLIREGEVAVLPLSFTPVGGPDDYFHLTSVLMATSLSYSTWQARLVDTEALTISEPLLTGESSDRDRAVTFPDGHSFAPGATDPLLWLGAFDAPESDSTHVLLPYFGLAEDVPVIDGQLDDLPAVAEGTGNIDPSAIDSQTFDLERYRERTDVRVGTETEGERSTTTLASDVLFEPDGWDLTGDADETLQAAISEIGEVEGGELEIVGHTDDVDGAVDNQELSENRATAVQDRLEELMDLSAFDNIVMEGRAANDPIAGNDSDEGRAANRRVELRYTAPQEAPALDEWVEAALPGTDAPTVSAGDAVEVTHSDGRTAGVNVESLHRVGDLFVGRLTVESRTGFGDDGEDHDGVPLAWPLTTGTQATQEGQGGTGTMLRTDAPTLLVGNIRLFPMSYVVAENNEGDVLRRPATDLHFAPTPNYLSGDTATATVLWPAVDTDSVTVDVPGETDNINTFTRSLWLDPWRITDAPVE